MGCVLGPGQELYTARTVSRLQLEGSPGRLGIGLSSGIEPVFISTGPVQLAVQENQTSFAIPWKPVLHVQSAQVVIGGRLVVTKGEPVSNWKEPSPAMGVANWHSS